MFTDYAAEAYLLNDPASLCYSPGIFARFGPRALAGVLTVPPGTTKPLSGSVWGLGCRYYRIDAPGASSLSMNCAGGEWGSDVTLAAGLAAPGYQRVAPTAHQRGAGILVMPLAPAANHAWLGVCGNAGRGNTEYSLEVTAI